MTDSIMSDMEKLGNALDEFAKLRDERLSNEFIEMRRPICQRVRGIEGDIKMHASILENEVSRLSSLEANLDSLKSKVVKLWGLMKDLESAKDQLAGINEMERLDFIQKREERLAAEKS